MHVQSLTFKRAFFNLRAHTLRHTARIAKKAETVSTMTSIRPARFVDEIRLIVRLAVKNGWKKRRTHKKWVKRKLRVMSTGFIGIVIGGMVHDDHHQSAADVRLGSTVNACTGKTQIPIPIGHKAQLADRVIASTVCN